MASTKNARSSLKGVVDSKYDGTVTHYRGIQYATIKKRFAKPVLNTQWQKTTDYTKFGPRCPQMPWDAKKHFQIPDNLESFPQEMEDEFKCDNLTISCPSDASSQKLPVIIWVHGGSQMVSAGSPGQRMGDTNPLVAQSIEVGKPVVLVSINYRLNIFAFGDSEGELNLDLQDQRIAIEWVRKYVSDFGGSPDNITLAGQSAGAVYIHALLASGTQVSRAILHSGSLYSTPPQPDKKCFGVLGLIEGNLQIMEMEKGNINPGAAVEATISGAPVKTLVQTLKDLSITRKWMWQEKSLSDWEQVDKVYGKLKGLMIGDVEAEGALYWFSVNKLKGANILKICEAAPGGNGKKLAEVYGISASDDVASQKGAAQFIGDIKFNLPPRDITQKLRQASKPVYRFQFDQVNPFSKQHQLAYHAVDLLAVFGAYDEGVGDEMKAIGRTLRSNWINFVHGEEPWDSKRVFTYGPSGMSGEISDEEAVSRRHEKHFEVLGEVGFDNYQEIYHALLAAGQSAE